jgi:hypothetical protein
MSQKVPQLDHSDDRTKRMQLDLTNEGSTLKKFGVSVILLRDLF